MSKFCIVHEETLTQEKVVHGKKSVVTLFIGVVKRDDGSRERGVGLKCPTQEKSIFRTMDSNDLLHYIRAFRMLRDMATITDQVVRDCITATKDKHCFKNFLKTSVCNKNGTYRQGMLRAAQIKAFDFSPSKELTHKVSKKFSEYGAALTGPQSALPPIEAPKEAAPPYCEVSPAQRGEFYTKLTQTQAG